ncbi:LCP family protein [Synechococcus sp. CBW1107]|uniref:LCP family protein n=1 Tax=Synechococcus sp. CBW1107 TaxID=2789857 RepID=UPI002AD53E76|nr:LCP family protein [Synechococcus sp. CBW1107]
MPPMRDTDPSTSSSSAEHSAAPRVRPVGKGHRWRALGRVVIALAGAGLGISVLGWIWPVQDSRSPDDRPSTASDLAEPPRRPITLLVVGLDSDRLPGSPQTPPATSASPAQDTAAKDNATAAKPAPSPNSDALLLVRVDPEGPLQVLGLPTELAVNLPGQKRPQALGSLYRTGGVALTGDAVRELLKLEPGEPDRYLVLSRAGLRSLVDALGRLEVNPPRKMLYEDKAQGYRIDLQSGLQQLDGAQVEQLLRYRDPSIGELSRRQQQELVVLALIESLAQPARLANLPDLVQKLRSEVDTNLEPSETLSLLAAGLARPGEVRFLSLPLGPAKPTYGGLRQLETKAPLPPWKTKT